MSNPTVKTPGSKLPATDATTQATAILRGLRTDRWAAHRKGNLYSRVAQKLNALEKGGIDLSADRPGEAYFTGPAVADLLGESFDSGGRK